MSDSDFFGSLLDGARIERVILDHLRGTEGGYGWLHEGLAFVERANDLPPRTLEQPNSWVLTADLDTDVMPESHLPAVLIFNTGLAEPPMREEDGTYTGKFAVGLVAIVGAGDREASHRFSQLYAAALRFALMAQPTLGGFAAGVEWVDEDYNPIPSRPSSRQLDAGSVIFRVEIPRILRAPAANGQTTPRDNPYAEPDDWPTVREDGASVEIDPVPLDQEPA